MTSEQPEAWLENRTTRSSAPHTEAEVCLNFWHYVDDTGMVMMLAAKAYALRGTDEEKLAVLKSLAATDYLTALQARVPEHYVVSTDEGELCGVIPASALQMDPAPVFDELIGELTDSFPTLFLNGKDGYREIHPRLTEPFLWVSTAVYESPDGELISRVS